MTGLLTNEALKSLQKEADKIMEVSEFAEQLHKRKLYDYQKDIVGSVIEKKVKVIRDGRI